MLVSHGDTLSKVGEIEVNKARLLGSYQEIEGKAQTLLMAIPEGQRWQVGPEGKAVVLPTPPNPVGAPPPQ